eukprot:gene4869-3490_t
MRRRQAGVCVASCYFVLPLPLLVRLSITYAVHLLLFYHCSCAPLSPFPFFFLSFIYIYIYIYIYNLRHRSATREKSTAALLGIVIILCHTENLPSDWVPSPLLLSHCRCRADFAAATKQLDLYHRNPSPSSFRFIICISHPITIIIVLFLWLRSFFSPITFPRIVVVPLSAGVSTMWRESVMRLGYRLAMRSAAATHDAGSSTLVRFSSRVLCRQWSTPVSAGLVSYRFQSSTPGGQGPEGEPEPPQSPAAPAPLKKVRTSTRKKREKKAVAPVPPAAPPSEAQPIPPPSSPTAAASEPAPVVKRKRERKKRAAAAPSDSAAAAEEADGRWDPPAAPPGPSESNLPDLGIEEGIRFFAQLQPDNRGTIKDSLLVYNTLTGRMTNDFSPTMKILLELGFSLNSNRQLVVTDPSKLNQLAAKIRSGETSVAALKWPNSLVKKLGSVLANTRISDPAEAIQQLIRAKINAISVTRYASAVAGAEDGNEPAAVQNGTEMGQGDPAESVQLNEEQERAIEIALRGHHLYLGGSAGTGKTVLLRHLCRRLQSHRLRVAMTATTGVAGCHIGGSTFHHAFGVSSQGEFVRRSGMLDYDVVIIDEVSMLSQRLFDSFDAVLREEAGTPDLPFGGVQIILCGDFLQLGCINESSVIYSRVFQKNFVKMRLQTIVRQNAYPEFAADLQLMRRGIVPENLTKKIQQLPSGTMVPAAVNLLPTNKEVHEANEKEMERLEGDALLFTPEAGITSLRCETTATMLLRTTPEFNEAEFSKHVCSLLQATLELPRTSLLSLYRVYEDGHAMRVMLPPGESVAWKEAMRDRFLEIAPLINEMELGATVTEIVPESDGLHTAECEEYLQRQMAKHPIAQPFTLKKGCRVLLRSNLSSVLVNGSIGTVVDFIECKLENFSRNIRNENLDNCIERYRSFCLTECAMPIPLVPVVQFHNGKTLAIPPWEFTVGGCPNTHYYSLSSVSIPLTLAYAFTVHKVQGLTLVGRVHLELSRMWPCEHLLYVAMSRVKNPDQLSMSSFEPSMIVANKDCVGFDVKLKDAKYLTQDVLKQYPVSSWKRCTDTIYHLRRQGSSLRSLLKEAGMMGKSAENQASESSSSNHEEASPEHLLAVENSVIVARRMRKLVQHVERVSKLRIAHQRAKERNQEVVAAEAPSGTDAAAEETQEDVGNQLNPMQEVVAVHRLEHLHLLSLHFSPHDYILFAEVAPPPLAYCNNCAALPTHIEHSYRLHLVLRDLLIHTLYLAVDPKGALAQRNGKRLILLSGEEFRTDCHALVFPATLFESRCHIHFLSPKCTVGEIPSALSFRSWTHILLFHERDLCSIAEGIFLSILRDGGESPLNPLLGGYGVILLCNSPARMTVRRKPKRLTYVPKSTGGTSRKKECPGAVKLKALPATATQTRQQQMVKSPPAAPELQPEAEPQREAEPESARPTAPVHHHSEPVTTRDPAIPSAPLIPDVLKKRGRPKKARDGKDSPTQPPEEAPSPPAGVPCVTSYTPSLLEAPGAALPYVLESGTRGIFFLSDASCMQWLHIQEPDPSASAVAALILMYVGASGQGFLQDVSSFVADPADLLVLLPSDVHEKVLLLLQIWPLPSAERATVSTSTPLVWVSRHTAEPHLLETEPRADRWSAVDAGHLSLFLRAFHTDADPPAAAPLSEGAHRLVSVASIPVYASPAGAFLIPYVCGLRWASQGQTRVAELANVIHSYHRSSSRTVEKPRSPPLSMALPSSLFVFIPATHKGCYPHRDGVTPLF